MRFPLLVAVGLAALLAAAAGLRAWKVSAPPLPPALPPRAEASQARDDAPIRFRDVTSTAGVDFRHHDGRTPMHYISETIGSGAAWVDFDRDGRLDIFLVQGGTFPPPATSDSSEPSSRMFRNNGDGTFTDVTADVGLVCREYGHGVTVGDYDNDGYPDLFVTAYGRCHLFHNEPGGPYGRRFRDATRTAGVATDGWCTCAAFADLHGRGFLDLYVGRYLVVDLEHYPTCRKTDRNPPIVYGCGPLEFRGTRGVLYRNNGDGTFTDVSARAGLGAEDKALGVVVADLDEDGRPDLFVGNDLLPNSHYRNLGGGKLKACGLESGTASNTHGRPVSSMGIEVDDVTGDGRPDIVVTALDKQGTVLFRNDGNNRFTDVSQRAGMYLSTWHKIGWGLCLIDADRDGNLDAFQSNGHIYRNAQELGLTGDGGAPSAFELPALLFRGDGRGQFRPVPDAGPYFARARAGRGAAAGDYDNDGAEDLLLNNCGEPAVLLRNETVTPHHWVRLQLEGRRHLRPDGSNRDAIGARVTVRAGGRTIVRQVKGGGSFLSSSDRRLLVGLGPAGKVDEVEVRWPNERADVQRFGPLEVNRSYKLVEGGSAEPVAYPRMTSPTEEGGR